MNRALFRSMFRQQKKKLLGCASGVMLYNLLMIGVYPSISRSEALTEVSSALPDSVKHLFGIRSGGELAQFSAYASSQCFGQIWLFAASFFTLTTADELIAKQTDRGAIAYLLSAPLERRELLATQAAVLTCGLASLIGLTMLSIAGEAAFFRIPLRTLFCFRLAVAEFFLFLAVGAYGLLFSALFDSERNAVLSGALLTFLFYALDLFSGLDSRFAWLKKLTLFGGLAPQEILEGKPLPARSLIFPGLSAFLYLLTLLIFQKKDIPV